jgi:hypothetical protein
VSEDERVQSPRSDPCHPVKRKEGSDQALVLAGEAYTLPARADQTLANGGVLKAVKGQKQRVKTLPSAKTGQRAGKRRFIDAPGAGGDAEIAFAVRLFGQVRRQKSLSFLLCRGRERQDGVGLAADEGRGDSQRHGQSAGGGVPDREIGRTTQGASYRISGRPPLDGPDARRDQQHGAAAKTGEPRQQKVV